MFRLFRPLSHHEMQLACAGILLGMLLCGIGQFARWSRIQLDTGAALCADTLRLHVRADSDTIADQSAKLHVRDSVLAFVVQHCSASDKPSAQKWTAQNLFALQAEALRTLGQLGIRVPVRVRLVNMYFDTTRYTNAVLPAGRYDALRIDIGADTVYGKNWWCVLYPSLCRRACGSYALPEENDLICGGYILRLRVVEWWNQRTADRRDLPFPG